ncbi:hypothetical protein P7K49_019114 [Saguinus oedipus]|uniref:Uncharacterized protein n=1 Tax=Saguinus oedipus TaxID=9490 RepID=A0ABQ9UWE2_SAGOE|nr:hypothetical protein P7K49_019114 [Saguinus oedipus]
MSKLLNPEEMTSRDYYFDSYAHFGIHESQRASFHVRTAVKSQRASFHVRTAVNASEVEVMTAIAGRCMVMSLPPWSDQDPYFSIHPEPCWPFGSLFPSLTKCSHSGERHCRPAD